MGAAAIPWSWNAQAAPRGDPPLGPFPWGIFSFTPGGRINPNSPHPSALLHNPSADCRRTIQGIRSPQVQLRNGLKWLPGSNSSFHRNIIHIILAFLGGATPVGVEGSKPGAVLGVLSWGWSVGSSPGGAKGLVKNIKAQP